MLLPLNGVFSWSAGHTCFLLLQRIFPSEWEKDRSCKGFDNCLWLFSDSAASQGSSQAKVLASPSDALATQSPSRSTLLPSASCNSTAPNFNKTLCSLIADLIDYAASHLSDHMLEQDMQFAVMQWHAEKVTSSADLDSDTCLFFLAASQMKTGSTENKKGLGHFLHSVSTHSHFHCPLIDCRVSDVVNSAKRTQTKCTIALLIRHARNACPKSPAVLLGLCNSHFSPLGIRLHSPAALAPDFGTPD